ncbi:MAG: molybdopterin-dependent oxidoreductase [Dissulfuribacterales bacterium]
MLTFQRFLSYRITFLIVLFLTPLSCFADPSATILKISGSVEHELELSFNDLKQFQSINVQHNEVSIANQFNGNFYFRGVPLRTLLEAAGIKKKTLILKNR